MTLPFFFLEKIRIKSVWAREFLGEFWGTFILVLIGNGSCAWFVLSKRDDVFTLNFAWAIAVMLGVSVTGGISGGHINPAVSLAMGTLRKLPWRKVPVYIAAQHLGAFAATVIVFAAYHDILTQFDGGNRTVSGDKGTATIWVTFPRMDPEYSETEPVVSMGTVFLEQIISAGLLMFLALALVDPRNLDYPRWMQPFAIGLMVLSIMVAFSSNCMAPMNPARDFACRIFTAIVGYGSGTFSPMGYHYWWVTGLFGPYVGGVVGGWLYYLGVELHWPEPMEKLEASSEHELKDVMNDTSNAKITK